MAVVLNGTDQYVDLSAHGAALDIRSAPLAFYQEFAFTSTSIMWGFSHGRDAGAAEHEYGFLHNASEDVAARVTTVDDGQNAVVMGGGVLRDGNLHRVLAVFRSSTLVLELWVDGGLEDTHNFTDADVAVINNNTAIGVDISGNQFFFDGEMSNCAVWSSEISAGDAADLTGGTITVDQVTGTLEGWWPLDFDARDESGNARDGTPVGSPTFTESPPGGETVTLAGTLPTLTADVTVNASADVDLSGQLPAIAADFSIGAEADVELAGSLPALEGSIDVAASADAQMAGSLPALVADFTVAAAAELELTGALPALDGSFTIAGELVMVELAGMLPAVGAVFDLAASADVGLDALLPALVGGGVQEFGPAPAARTFVVPAENRTHVVAAEPVAVVPYESRLVVIRR